MLDTQMPRNSQRDKEEVLTVEQELLKSKDKTIQLLANALKDACDWSTFTRNRYRELADKYLDKKMPGKRD